MTSVRSRPRIGLALAIGALVLAGVACEKPTHENVENWRRTKEGPGKLLKALKNSELDADLRAHAAQVLVAVEKGSEVREAVGAMKDAERRPILAKLAPRLWDDCKLSDQLARPNTRQLFAKDTLFEMRQFANDPERDQIDQYLLDWLTGFYEGRAGEGLHTGEEIIRAMGTKAAPKLIAAARGVLEEKTDDGRIRKLDDGTLSAIAFTSSPEGVTFLLDLAEQRTPHADDSLQIRALGALYLAYVMNEQPPRLDPAVLRPFIPRLQGIAAAPMPVPQPGENVNVAFDLIAVAGKPHCIAPFAALAAHEEEPRRWRAVQKGLECAGVDAVVAMAEALPQKIGYAHGILEKYFWDKVVALGPGAAGPARTLLASKSWVGRLTGIEVLARLGTPADAAAVRALARDSAKAKGWWEKEDDPKARKQREPTLGARAAAAANTLEKKK